MKSKTTFILIGFLLTSLMLFYSCRDSEMKRNKRSKFYPILVSNEWVVINDVNWSLFFSYRYRNDTTLKLVRLNVYMDTITAEGKRDCEAWKMNTSKFTASYRIPVLEFDTNGGINYKDSINVVFVDSHDVMELRKGEWGLDSDKVTLDITGCFYESGGHDNTEDDFHYKNEYQIFSLDSNNLTLKLIRKIVSKDQKNKRKDMEL